MGVSLSDTDSDTLVFDTDPVVDDTPAWGVHNTDRTHPCPRDDHHHLRHSCDADHLVLGEEEEEQQHDRHHDELNDDGWLPLR